MKYLSLAAMAGLPGDSNTHVSSLALLSQMLSSYSLGSNRYDLCPLVIYAAAIKQSIAFPFLK